MKIVHILADLCTGGGQKFAIDLCNELAQDPANEVYIFVLDKIDDSFMLVSKISDKVELISADKVGGFSLKTVPKIYKILSKIKPDVVHTHLRALAYSSVPLILLKIPTIHTVHNVAQKEIGTKIRRYYKFLYDYFNFRPVSISHQVLESVKSEYGNNQIELIYNGTKALNKTKQFEKTEDYINSLKKTPNTKVFINIARVSEQKNQVMLIEAFEELLSSGEDVLLLIIGSIDQEYKQKCDKVLKSHDYIRFEGVKNNISDYLISSDALCLSSLYEGLPIVILEAFSCAKPTITTPAGGVVDVIEHQKTGFISKGFSKDEYVALIKEFIKDPSLKDNLKELFDKNYNITTTAKKYLELYKKVTNS